MTRTSAFTARDNGKGRIAAAVGICDVRR